MSMKTDAVAGRSSPQLGFLLRQAAAAHRLKMERALADLAVTPPQMLVMTLIDTNRDCSNADIARLASLTTATVTVILNNLAGRDLFCATRHPIDKRIKLLRLSNAGIALLADCRKRAAIVENDLKGQLAAADIDVLTAWLKRASESN